MSNQLDDWFSTCAEDTVNNGSGEWPSDDRWTCSVCGRHHSTRAQWAQCETSCAEEEERRG